MDNKKDNPGVFIPPPLFYICIFLLSFVLQRLYSIKQAFFFHSLIAIILGVIFILTSLIFSIPALLQFFKSKNTIVPIKPASSLQVSGIYSISRNPMYLGLLLLYIGMALIFGNWWTVFLIPVLVLLVHFLIIIREEKYLLRAFGSSYSEYIRKVRRWI
jgi:protein-S-isoprenylcysteine O-methyltransferase Ste14